MTIGIVVACADGVVVGADRKVTRSRGTRIKSLEDKIHQMDFKDRRPLLVCSSGTADLARRAMEEIKPSDYGADLDCYTFRDIVEGRISRLQSRLSDRGLEYDATLLFATVDTDGKPVIGHITPSGMTEIKHEGYFTTGIAAPYAELVLQDSYAPTLSVSDARLIVGGLIERIGKVDNDVEGMDVSYISITDKEVHRITRPERDAIEQEPLSFDFKEELDDLKQAVSEWEEFYKNLFERRPRRPRRQRKAPEAEPSAKENQGGKATQT